MAMDEVKIKVTDRRLFDLDGELREEYASEDSEPSEPAPAPAEVASQRRVAPTADSHAAAPEEPADERPTPEAGPSESWDVDPDGAAGFVDLVASLAEPIALFLGDAQLPGGESAKDLGRARFYIDLLKVLRDKTKGNLSAQEDALLSDLIYRLQLRYVQKRG